MTKVKRKKQKLSRRGFFDHLVRFSGLGIIGGLVLIFHKSLNGVSPTKSGIVIPDEVYNNLEVGKFLLYKGLCLFENSKTPRIMSLKCTHLGCEVIFDKTQKEFVCPCHKSRFDLKGNSISGPGVKNLQLLEPTRIENGWMVLITK